MPTSAHYDALVFYWGDVGIAPYEFPRWSFFDKLKMQSANSALCILHLDQAR